MEVVRAERRHPREASPEVLARHAQQVAALEQALAALQQEHDAFRTTAEEVCACEGGFHCAATVAGEGICGCRG